MIVGRGIVEIDKRIIELKELIYRKHSLEKKLADINDLYFYLKDKLRSLVYKLEDMDISIKELDKKSIIYLWYEIFTSKGKKVTKIEHEYKIYSNLSDFIHPEIIELRNKIDNIAEYEKEYKQLMEEKAKLSVESEKESDDRLLKLIDETVKYKNRIRDLNEAINAGNFLNSSFKHLVDLLNQTKDWDSFDIFGRGLFLSLTKTTVFKSTDDKIKKLHYLANKFTRELKAINFYMDLGIDAGDILKYVDYFENQLYDDIKDKDTIVNTISQIKDAYEVINKTIEHLKSSKEKYLKQLIQIEREKDSIKQGK